MTNYKLMSHWFQFRLWLCLTFDLKHQLSSLGSRCLLRMGSQGIHDQSLKFNRKGQMQDWPSWLLFLTSWEGHSHIVFVIMLCFPCFWDKWLTDGSWVGANRWVVTSTLLEWEKIIVDGRGRPYIEDTNSEDGIQSRSKFRVIMGHGLQEILQWFTKCRLLTGRQFIVCCSPKHGPNGIDTCLEMTLIHRLWYCSCQLLLIKEEWPSLLQFPVAVILAPRK